MGDHDQPLWRQAAAHTLHAAILMKTAIEERLVDRIGLLLADHEALLNLSIADDGLRMSDVADRLVLSRGGTTKVIDRLETLGYVERRPDPEDRRATIVGITTEGRQAVATSRSIVDEYLEAEWASELTDDEARTVLRVMERVGGTG